MAEAQRQPDVIDTAPAFVQADADALNARFAGVDTGAMLTELLAGELKGRIAIVSSFGAESAALLHLVAAVDKTVPLIFINTQKTGEKVSIPLHEKLRQILIDNEFDVSRIRISNQKFNYHVKELGEKAGINQLVEIVKTSIVSFNLTKVAYCIAMITILTLSNRHQPERSDA